MAKVTAGIDIGSRTIKFVLAENGKIVYSEIVDNGYDSYEICKKFLDNHNFSSVVATGYGRTLLEVNENIPTISEIKAFAIGINKLIEGENKIVLDIGGQDTKFIKIKNGKVVKFEMNDRCAAGTGKFFEIMAKTLGYSIEDFSKIEPKNVDIKISSMCAVFAESEITSLISNGVDREIIAIALHNSIVKRIMGKLKKFLFNSEKIIFCGGCAKNRLLVKILEEELNRKLIITGNPQIVGAYGAASI